MRGEPTIFRQAALERLSSPDQLDHLMQVTKPQGWLALVAVGVPILAVLFWGIFGLIPIEVSARGVLLRGGGPRGSVAEQLTARLYVPTSLGRQIRPGMAVRITLSAPEGGEQGDLKGRVVGVSEVGSLPPNPLLRDERLSAELILRGRLIQVEVSLQGNDPATPAGRGRTVATDPDPALARGISVNGSITVHEVRPIRLVLGGWR